MQHNAVLLKAILCRFAQEAFDAATLTLSLDPLTAGPGTFAVEATRHEALAHDWIRGAKDEAKIKRSGPGTGFRKKFAPCRVIKERV